jgi:hypothetical protein
MLYRLILATFLLAFSANSQLNRFQKVEWIVTSFKGLNTSFLVDFKLTTNKGKTVVVDHATYSYKWEAFKFKSDRPIGFNYGVGFYYNMNDFQGVDSIRVEATCASNEALNSVFYIPVKYCVGLDLPAYSITFNDYAPLDWIMIMNTGERFPYDKDWVNLKELVNESDARFTFSDETLITNSKEPFRSAMVRFRHPNVKRPVFEREMAIVVSNQLKLDFSGKSGRMGRKGQNGTQASESGDYGETGEDGTSADKQVTVFVKPYTSDSIPLLEVIAISDSRKKHVFISALNPKIKIDASGGRGGTGGDGGNGASALQTENSYNRLSAGAGGAAGYGGNGGDAGIVVIFVDSVLHLTESNFVVDTSGGQGGSAGKAGVGPSARALNQNTRASGSAEFSGRAGKEGKSTIRIVDAETLENKLRGFSVE